jgi:2-keto-3-deoxy-L-rhamnonate aldolase RhmA
MVAMHVAAALRSRQPLMGYWVTSDSPAIAERLASVGYDYICLDAQHGLLDYPGGLHDLTAVAAAGAAGVVRVPPGDPAWIGRALDAGARGVIVPLVSTCGMHCTDGDAGARSLADGFTFVSISSDLSHLQAIGRDHLARARSGRDGITAEGL